VSATFPPQEPGRHGWAELLTLVGAVRPAGVRHFPTANGGDGQNPGRIPRLRPPGAPLRDLPASMRAGEAVVQLPAQPQR
jgi:hypothetical protein